MKQKFFNIVRRREAVFAIILAAAALLLLSFRKVPAQSAVGTGSIVVSAGAAGTWVIPVTIQGYDSSGNQINSQTLTVNLTVNNPTPAISSLDPPAITVGAGSFSLAVNGSNFVPGAVVRWNGSDRPTTFAGANKLTASISAADVSSVGAYPVTAFNPSPGGGFSNSVNFTVNPPPAACSYFKANPSQIVVPPPASSTLSWSCANATFCSISPGVGSVNPSAGSAIVSPATTTQYTLTCLNSISSQSYSATVTVFTVGVKEQ